MNMPVPVDVIRAAVARLLVAHDAQDARRICLQHTNNNHRNATAKDSQAPPRRHCRVGSGGGETRA